MRLEATGTILTAWLAVAAVLVVGWTAGYSPNADPDDLLKLVKIRAYLDGAGWFDQTVPGILQPEPFLSHWPRLLDLPYALPAALLSPFAGREAALAASTFLLPLLLLLPALAFYRAIVGALGFARPDLAFLLSLIPASRAFFEFAPERIDYHNIQVVCLLGSIALTLARGRLAALANGALIALAMATSVEFAPFFALTAAIHLWEFVTGREGCDRRLGLFGAGMAAGAALGFVLVVAPAAYSSVACETFSLPHLTALVLAGATFLAATLLPPRPYLRGILAVVGAAATAMLLVRLFPQCLAGPYGDLGPYLTGQWLLDIPQERSLLSRPDFVLSADMVNAALLVIGATAPAVIVALGGRDRGMVVFGLFALLAGLMAILYFRYFRYLPLFAGPGLLLALAALVPGLRAQGALLANRLCRWKGPAIAVLMPGLAASALLVTWNALGTGAASAPPGAAIAEGCATSGADDWEWPDGARIMAPPLVGIELLPRLTGDAAVVAVPFHTGRQGLENAYRFLDPATPDPRALLDAARATHVMLCAWREAPSAMLEARYPFTASLMEGRAPDWLAECPTDPSQPTRIYRYPAGGGAACPGKTLYRPSFFRR